MARRTRPGWPSARPDGHDVLMAVHPSQITWMVSADARRFLDERFGDLYWSHVEPFRTAICGYINAENECLARQGKRIAPIAGGDNGWKWFKMRWALPGVGASGALRLYVALHCESRQVEILAACRRKDQ